MLKQTFQFSMATVIVGAGIIGTATAYYLSESCADPSSIHIIESAPRLFASASGYAGGFLARDWFSAPAASLGELSFHLHRKLAEEHNGAKRWGYAASTALSLALHEGRGVGKGERGEDWLLEGTSRADVLAAEREGDMLKDDGTPAWITRQKDRTLDIISSEDGCAQVEPRQLCEFLMEESQSRGVQLHMPARALSVVTGHDGAITGIVVQNSSTKTSHTIPCKNILIAAGPWTPRAFTQLFPASNLHIPISPLAGHSINVRTPRHTLADETRYAGRCHAVFSAPSPKSGWTFAPEAISRVGGEIFVAGLNSQTMPLPRLATDAQAQIDPGAIEELKRVTARLVGTLAAAGPDTHADADADATGTTGVKGDDLEVTREALCFRPVARGGIPIIARIRDEDLGLGRGGDGKSRMPGGEGGGGGRSAGVYIAAGHGPWGISLSLGTGLVVAEMVQGVKTTSARIDGLGMR